MRILLVLLLLTVSITRSQIFTSSPLIQTPGVNTNYDFIFTWYPNYPNETAFICFENQTDNIYSIILKQLSPINAEPKIIYSDSIPQINPSISFTEDFNVRIVWQSKIDNKWQLLSRIYAGDSLSSVIQLTENEEDCVTPSLHFSYLCWIQGFDLKLGILDDSLHSTVTIDNNCSNPEIMHESDLGPTTIDIVYEKDFDSFKLIKYAFYNDRNSEFETIILSDSSINTNPKFGHSLDVSYQRFVDGFWRAVISDQYGYDDEWISEDRLYNMENPVYFTYPIPTKDNNNSLREFFLVYESDSIQNNREIIFEYYPIWDINLKINLSNMSGDDTHPYSTVINDSVVIFWINNISENSSHIWWSKAAFDPYSNIKKETINPEILFTLHENYPNPFNPITNISFRMIKEEYISLVIYDNNGRKVREIFCGQCQPGYHSMQWDGKNDSGIRVSSGNYLCTLRSKNMKLSRKMQLVK